MVTLTTNPSYYLPVKPRITFKSPDGQDTYMTFNAFSSPKDFNLIYCDCDNAMSETGTFNVMIEDSDNVLARDHLHNAKVYIELGKTEAELQHFIIGFADIMDINEPRTNYQDYRLSGFGSAIQLQELLLLVRQAAKKDDTEFTVKALYERCLTENKFRPLNREDIESLTGFDHDISDALKSKWQTVNEVFTTPWDFYDRLAALDGNDWFIDFRAGGKEVLVARNPLQSHTGKTIKSGDLRSSSDDATKVSYIKDLFTIVDDSSTNAGVRTRLYTTTNIEQEVVKENLTDKGRTTLDQRFIAQQVDLLNDQRRITDLKFILERIGEPASPKNRVNGFVILDEGDTPTGRILGTFNVDIGQLERDPDEIIISDINIKSRFIEGGAKIWLAFTDRSGIKGNVESDPKNTVAWHHDGTVNTVHAAGTLSATATATELGREHPEDANWKVSTNGPVYNFSVMSSIKRLQSRSNITAAKKLRYKEAFIDSSFLTTPETVNRFLALNLNPMSKTRRTINGMRVTIPNNFLYKPYQMVTFAHGLSGISMDLQVNRAGYIISALPGDPQYGTYTAEVTLNGAYNPLIGSCGCE